MNINSWQNNTLTDFNNSQQQPFIQAWRTREKLKKHTLEVSKNEVVQKFPARESFGEEEANEEESLREEMRKSPDFYALSLSNWSI